ncbi:MAG: DUF2852 domain-containing protein [Dinoroseobacter sp.]|nr:DUF2852 domain-containing protein [Dinoroseobacter sp.]
MNIAHSQTAPTVSGWFSRSEAWLDSKGKGAWIAAMVLGFIFFWPIGLALLAYMIWSKRMSSGNCASRRNSHRRRHGFNSSGNTAFDAYKADTLQRLQDEQDAFEAFLKRLRDAKDKTEFDQFMDERSRNATAAPQSDVPAAPQAEGSDTQSPQQG